MADVKGAARCEGQLVRPADASDAPAMAALHARCFPIPWSEAGMRDHLGDEACLAFQGTRHDGCTLAGFVIARMAADEAEILTLAVAPDSRAQGLGEQLLRRVLACLPDHGVTRVFLEVAADNRPARALYEKLGFGSFGRRKGYYRRANMRAEDAICLARAVGDR